MQMTPGELAIIDATLRLTGPEPLAFGVLLDQLAGQGLLESLESDDPDEIVDFAGELLSHADELWITFDDECIVRIDQRLDATVFTHRITTDDLERAALRITPDLVVLDHALGLGAALQLANGRGDLVVDFDVAYDQGDRGALVGPAGWLDEFTTGDLVMLTRRGTTIEVARAGDDLADGATELRWLRERYERLSDGEPVGLEPSLLVLDALALDPATWKAPTRPIAELLAECGLVLDGIHVGPADREWSRRDAAAERLAAELSDEFRFAACCHVAFSEALDAFRAFDDPALEPTLDCRRVGTALVHGDVAQALVAFAHDLYGLDDMRIAIFAQQLAGEPGPSRAAGAYMTALVLDAVGDAESAAVALEQAVTADSSFGAAVDDHADALAERGELDRAIKVRQRLDLEDDDELTFLLTLRPVHRSGIGRNEPCPCGSGKKYKNCCLDKPAELSASAHARWLLHKLTKWVFARDHRDLVIGIVEEALQTTADDRQQTIAEALYESGLVASWAVFDGGIGAHYLETRVEILPAIERDMLADWVTRPLQLLEVTEQSSGSSLRVSDVRTGEALVVHDHSDDDDRSVGQLLLCHIGLVGGQFEIVGTALLVEPNRRDAALDMVDDDPDAFDVAAWFATLNRP